MKFRLYVGLGGSFGGAHYHSDFEGTEDEAWNEAWELACEEFERYGNHFTEIYKEAANIPEDEFDCFFHEERERWLSYRIELIEEGDEL